MGGFLSQIRGKSVAVDSALLNSTHSKLIEYYSSYKSICQAFTISIPEYTQIFGPNQLSFAVWDSKGKGKIDAIQMFAGLLIFSKIKYEQKIKFLFEIFDFNEEGFLLYENLAFMLLNICNATYKIFCISKTIAQNQIELFLDQYFTEDSRIELPKLVRWTTKNKFTISYFKEIGYQIDQPIEQRKIDILSDIEGQLLRKKVPSKLYDKQFRFDQDYINCLDTLVDNRRVDQQQMMNLQFKWLYGIQIGKENIKFVRVKKQKAGNQRIIYSIGKVIVIYYPKLNIQRYYKGHIQNISVIQVSKFKKIIASAQCGENPSIHIWDIQNQLNLIKFKRIHKEKIKYLKFFKNDRFLITASESVRFGGQIESPIVVLKLDTKEIVMSTYLNMQIIGILPIESIKQSTALLISNTYLTIFTQENRSFNTQKVELNNGNPPKQIIAFVLHPKGYLITAHKNREFCKWDQNYKCFPITYDSLCRREVIQMCLIGEETLIVLDKEDIEIININVQEHFALKRRNMLNLKSTKLYNLHLYSMQVIQQNKLLLVSQFGDIIKISQIQSKQTRLQKYYQIFKMDQISNVFFPNPNTIVFITSFLMYVVDRYENELKALNKYDIQIKLSDSFKQNLVIISNVGKEATILTIISLHDYMIKQTYKFGSFTVDDIKITENHILVLSQISLIIFHRVQDKYLSKQPVLHKIEIGKMLSFAKENDQRNCFIVNQNKFIYKLPLNTSNNQIDIQKIDKLQDFNQYEQLSIPYPQHNYRHPFVFSSNRRFVALGLKNGDVFVWESLSQTLSYFSSHTLLSFHTGRISRLVLSQNEFFTTGGFNGMAIQYEHKQYIQGQEDNQIMELEEDEPNNTLSKIPITKTKWKQSEVRDTIAFKELQEVGLRQGQVQIQGIKDTQDNQVYSLILQILTPSNKLFFQANKGNLNTNKLVLQSDYVYGMDVNLISKNIHYIHSYACQNPNKHLDEHFWHDNSSETNKEELKYCKNALEPIDNDHNNCKRQILYACDKYCVINQKNSPQLLYKFHRRKVSAIAVHPNRQLVCSCQVSTSFAEIHFWKYNQRSLYINFITKHRSIITRAQFSRDGSWVVTLGGVERAQSIQIINWQNEQTIAFRFIEDQSIKQILFNPYDKKQLCLAGLNLIRLYRVQEQLIIKEECRILDQHFQTITYISNIYGSQIESDVITGSQEGDIGLYVCGSFLYSHKKAHEKGITCLRLVQLFQYKKVLVSGGGDGYVRIWDVKFNEISKKNIRDELYSIKSNCFDMPQTIIISIDVYQCQRKQSNQNIASALMLIATSDGSILEATITNQFQGYKAVNLTTAETQTLKEKINFDVSLALASSPNHYSIKFQVCNNFLVTFSSESKFLYFWNMNFSTRQRIFTLPNPPLFLTKMNKRPILLLGIHQPPTTVLKMYQLQFSAGIYLKSINLYGQIQFQKGNFIPLNGYFSKSDNQLALQIKNETMKQIWIYKKGQNVQGINYIFSIRISLQNDVLCRIIWMQFSTAEEAILVAQSQLKKQANLTHLDLQVKYKCYDCNNGSSLGLGYEFNKFDFSAKIKAFYQPWSLATQSQKDYSTKDAITITVMAQYKQYLLLGTLSGEVIIVQSEIFAKKQISPKYYARYYVVCDSPINKLQIRQSDLIVGSQLGEGIFILKMNIEKGLQTKQVYVDPFNQCPSVEQLQKRYKQVFLKRKKILSETQFNNANCAIKLKLSAVIGRSAFYKRNNIFIDLKDNIIAFSGCNLLIMKHQQGQRINQKIIKPEAALNSIHPEITCMALGDCKKFLLIGTSQQNAKIIAWDISTNTYLYDIKLNSCITINLIKLSFSNKHAIIYATAKNSHKYLIFINLINRSVIAIHHFHVNIQINDLAFALNNQYRILACGVKYMAQWNYCNGILAEKMYSFSLGQNQEMKSSAIIFYSLIFIEDYAISCGSDGYLYIWKDQKLVKRQNAHPKESILTLYTSLNSKIFVSGANNGIIIIWHFSSSLIIQKLDEYSTYFGKQHIVPVKYQIQSICMTKQSLIIGNRAGQIMHFPFSQNDKKIQEVSSTASHKIPLPILSAFNHVAVNSCAFNASSKKLYVMTEAEGGFGTFSVFDVATLQKIKQEKIQLKSPLVRMFVCKNSAKIFFILKNFILTYTYQAQGKDDKNKLSKGKQSLKFDLQIKAAAINKAQTFLAILVAPGPLQNAKIQIFNLQVPKQQFYAIYKIQQNLQASIDVIDFGRDHNYLVYQGADQEETIIDLMTKQKIKVSALQNPPQWNEQANRTTPSIKQITNFYGEENKLLKVIEVINKCVIATDEIGIVRVFPYPVTPIKQQNKAYIEHLNQIYLCVLSPDNRTLVTVSRQDRAIHLWDVIHKQKDN